MKPLLIYDGDCGFCRRWIERWRSRSKDRVDFAPYQKVHSAYPEISVEDFKRSAQFIDEDEKVLSGAAGIYKTLSYIRGWGWLNFLYQRLPGFAALSEWGYRVVASNRMFFSRWMPSERPEANYRFSAARFLQGLGLIYIVAFASLLVQVKGLIGETGISPAAEFLKAVSLQYPGKGFWLLPSVFWLDAGDAFLMGGCWAGMAAGALIVFRRFALPALFVAWLLYLSYLNIALEFMSFQWDILLVETGFLALFLTPWQLSGYKTQDFRPGRVIRFFFLLLLFRVMFFSGLVKILSGDATWRGLTALTFHYETQPLPTWSSWFVHHLPELFHRVSAGFMFVIELAVPFLLFIPVVKLRRTAALLLIMLQVLIFLTGNYTFFNLLSGLLCLFALDDAFWLRKKTAVQQEGESCAVGLPLSPVRHCPLIVVLVVTLILGSLTYVREGGRMGVKLPENHWIKLLIPYHLVNTYGLFARMTTERPEILVEGSSDGISWQPYLFRYKPVALDQRPKQVAPHQPRLDWQMWFAALSDLRRNVWLARFCERLLEGNPAVLALMDPASPFLDAPPRFIRARIFDYRFTTPAERKATGHFWKRREMGTYLPVITLNRA